MVVAVATESDVLGEWPICLGYPGEGPKKRAGNNQGGRNQHAAEGSTPATARRQRRFTPYTTPANRITPPPPAPRRQPPASGRHRGGGAAAAGGASRYNDADVEALLASVFALKSPEEARGLRDAPVKRALRVANKLRSDRNLYKRKTRQLERELEQERGEEDAGPSYRKEEVSQRQCDERVMPVFEVVRAAINPLPDQDTATLLDWLLRSFPRSVRDRLAKLPAMLQEHFLGGVAAVRKLREHYTALATLDVRLEHSITYRALSFINHRMCREQHADGTWHARELLPLPAPHREARDRGIHTSCKVPLVMAPAKHVASACRDLVKPYTMHVTEAGKCIAFDFSVMAGDCLAATRARHNMREPCPLSAVHHPRIQIMFDAFAYKRGRSATRFGLRCMDVRVDWSSQLYFRDVAFYCGLDKAAFLRRNLAKPLEFLNAGVQWQREREPNAQLEWRRDHVHTWIEIDVAVKGKPEEREHCLLFSGGDAASANAESDLESPAGPLGCCYWCVLRKSLGKGKSGASPWFDEAQCEAAERRTAWRSHVTAHHRPPWCPVDVNPVCGCGFECTLENVAAEAERRSCMTVEKQKRESVAHRNSPHHNGQEPGLGKIVYCDHRYRQFSALHLMLNNCGSLIAVTLAGGCKPALAKRVNALLLERGCFWHIKENKAGRDKRPNGNECRRLLFSPGLLLELLELRYGKASSEAAKRGCAELDRLQEAGAHLQRSPTEGPEVEVAEEEEQAAPRGKSKAKPKPAKEPAAAAMGLDAEALRAALAAAQAPGGAAPAPAPAAAAAGEEGEEEEQEPEEVEAMEEDWALPEAPDKVVEQFDSALTAWICLVRLQLELYLSWDDHVMAEREKHGEEAQRLGKALAIAARSHAGNTIAHLYLHVGFAHLKELIVTNGHPYNGDDGVLERGNGLAKSLNKIVLRGKGEGNEEVQQIRFVREYAIKEGTKSVKVPTGRVVQKSVKHTMPASQEQQLATHQLARTLLMEQRVSVGPSICEKATLQNGKRARGQMKAEQLTTLTHVRDGA